MTYQQATSQLPRGAHWSCSFGYPGEDNYCELWRDGAARWEIRRRDHYENAGWTITRLIELV